VNIFSPHYDYGRSITRFTINKLAIASRFPLRRGLNFKAKKNLRDIRNSKSGKIALVLGNGPSLDTLNVDSIRDHVDDIFVCNDFYSLQIAKSIKADYYCFSDPFYFVNSKKFHENRELVDYLEKSSCLLYISHFYRSQIEKLSFPFLLFNDREWFFFNKNISPTKSRAYSSVTIYKGLALACYMGYSKIYILGIDNTEFDSYRSNSINEIFMGGENNYANRTDDAQILGRQVLKFPGDLAGRFHSLANLFHDLRLFSRFPIINLDPNSLITVFPKYTGGPLQTKNM